MKYLAGEALYAYQMCILTHLRCDIDTTYLQGVARPQSIFILWDFKAQNV